MHFTALKPPVSGLYYQKQGVFPGFKIRIFFNQKIASGKYTCITYFKYSKQHNCMYICHTYNYIAILFKNRRTCSISGLATTLFKDKKDYKKCGRNASADVSRSVNRQWATFSQYQAMDEYAIEVIIDRVAHGFTARLLTTGYTHRFMVMVNTLEVSYEPDEEQNYRAMLGAADSIKASKTDIAIIMAIGERLNAAKQ